MKSPIIAVTAALALLTGLPFALAQTPAAPVIVSPAVTGMPAAYGAPGRYTGPSSVPISTVKSVLENGRDKQQLRLQGRIVSQDGGKYYSFADDSGRMPVEISAKYFPVNQSVSAEQRVELVGEVDKDFRQTKFEVKELRLLP